MRIHTDILSMGGHKPANMPRRALMTEREREIILDSSDEEIAESYRYETISRVRKRITEELVKDMEVAEEHGGLAEDIREVVCSDRE